MLLLVLMLLRMEMSERRRSGTVCLSLADDGW